MSEDPLTPEGPTSVSVQSEAPSHEGGVQGDGQPRPHRRRRRRRRRGGRGEARGASFERTEDLSAVGPERPAEGVLYVPPKDTAPGVLVSAKANYLPSPKDPLVPRELIQREGLEAGAFIAAIGFVPTLAYRLVGPPPLPVPLPTDRIVIEVLAPGGAYFLLLLGLAVVVVAGFTQLRNGQRRERQESRHAERKAKRLDQAP